MDLTFSVRHFLQNLKQSIIQFLLYIWAYIIKDHLRPDTRPCQILKKFVVVNTEIVAEQLCFSAMKSTSPNTINGYMHVE
jgi:hypothetical protein